MAQAKGAHGTVYSNNEIDKRFATLSDEVEARHEVLFSEKEVEIAECYDRLEELRLQRAILEAQAANRDDPFTGLSDEEVERNLEEAQKEYVDARAGYLLKNCIVEDVVQSDPMIKAVHSGANASPMERALHPLVDQRDILALSHANLSAGISSTANTLTGFRTENLKAMQQNRELTTKILALTKKTKQGNAEDIRDPELQAQLKQLQQETRESRKQYRIIKSVVSGMISASGVDWADHELQELVLDDEAE